VAKQLGFNLDERFEKRIVRDDRLGLFIGGCAKPRIKVIRQFVRDTRELALIHVDVILGRGNFARLVNVAGEYHITELGLES
jgi:hypothetical protein